MLVKSIFCASFLILGIAYLLFYTHLGGISNFITIGFDGFRVINYIGGVGEARGIFITATAINIINLVLAAALYGRDRFLAKLLSFISLSVSVLILITVGFIIVSN